MRVWIHLVLLICPTVSYTQQAKIEIPRSSKSPPLEETSYIDDSRLLRLLQSKLEKAIEEKVLPEATLLREQLEQSHTSVSLDEIPPSNEAMSPQQIYQKRLGSVLILGNLFKCDKCDKWHLNTAGGVVLTRNGIAATNHHVIENKKAAGFGALTRDGVFYPVLEVLAANDDDDVALIRLEGDRFSAAPLGEARIGDAVAVISHPDKHFYTQYIVILHATVAIMLSDTVSRHRHRRRGRRTE